MLFPHLKELLQKYGIVLASGSPRRRELLQLVIPNPGDFTVQPPADFDEASAVDQKECSGPEDYVQRLAKAKASAAAAQLLPHAEAGKGHLVIGADTVIYSSKLGILGKPHTDERAFSMLSDLSGEKHQVFTGVAVYHRTVESEIVELFSFSEETEVEFATLTPEIIRAYVATGEPLDKAGSYGIQGHGGTLISGIRGDYYNVVGLPIHKLAVSLSAAMSGGSL